VQEILDVMLIDHRESGPIGVAPSELAGDGIKAPAGRDHTLELGRAAEGGASGWTTNWLADDERAGSKMPASTSERIRDFSAELEGWAELEFVGQPASEHATQNATPRTPARKQADERGSYVGRPLGVLILGSIREPFGRDSGVEQEGANLVATQRLAERIGHTLDDAQGDCPPIILLRVFERYANHLAAGAIAPASPQPEIAQVLQIGVFIRARIGVRKHLPEFEADQVILARDVKLAHKHAPLGVVAREPAGFLHQLVAGDVEEAPLFVEREHQSKEREVIEVRVLASHEHKRDGTSGALAGPCRGGSASASGIDASCAAVNVNDDLHRRRPGAGSRAHGLAREVVGASVTFRDRSQRAHDRKLPRSIAYCDHACPGGTRTFINLTPTRSALAPLAIGVDCQFDPTQRLPRGTGPNATAPARACATERIPIVQPTTVAQVGDETIL
jgi:hypothetical protein